MPNFHIYCFLFFSYVTASKLLPLCKGLQRVTVFNQRNVMVDKAKELANALCASMDRTFLRMEYDPVLSETTALDPRFKKFAFSDNKAVDEALQRISAAATRCNPSSLSAPPSEGQEGEVGAGVGSEEPQASAVWRLFDERATGDTAMRNSTADAVLEVRSYLQEPLIQRAEDPLKWWEAKASCYPRLVKVMVGRLCIVATAVFSKTGQITKKREVKSDQPIQAEVSGFPECQPTIKAASSDEQALAPPRMSDCGSVGEYSITKVLCLS